MDDTVIPSPAPEAPTEPDHTTMAAPPPSAPPSTGRRVPIWAALVGAVVAMLVAFGGGYAIASAEADDAKADRDAAEASLAKAEASLAEAEAALDQCQDAVEGAGALATAATTVADNFEELQRLLNDFNASAVGSAEEAELATALTEKEGQLTRQIGALSASAERVSADSEACAPG